MYVYSFINSRMHTRPFKYSVWLKSVFLCWTYYWHTLVLFIVDLQSLLPNSFESGGHVFLAPRYDGRSITSLKCSTVFIKCSVQVWQCASKCIGQGMGLFNCFSVLWEGSVPVQAYLSISLSLPLPRDYCQRLPIAENNTQFLADFISFVVNLRPDSEDCEFPSGSPLWAAPVGYSCSRVHCRQRQPCSETYGTLQDWDWGPIPLLLVNSWLSILWSCRKEQSEYFMSQNVKKPDR